MLNIELKETAQASEPYSQIQYSAFSSKPEGK